MLETNTKSEMILEKEIGVEEGKSRNWDTVKGKSMNMNHIPQRSNEEM